MFYELKDWNSLEELLEEIKRNKSEQATDEGNSLDNMPEEIEPNDSEQGEKKTLEKYYGCLNWGIDALEYQKACRSEWDERERKLEEVWRICREKKGQKPLADIYDKLKQGLDELEYQKTYSNEWV
jgi:hypothetical protein